MSNGGIIGAKNTSTSGIWTMEDVLLDTNGIRTTLTPMVGSYEKAGVIIGVQDTGTRSVDGAGLVQVEYGSNAIAQTTLDAAYFNKHPAYQFNEYIYGGNYFRRIPITYWWRGNLPSVSDGTTPRWTMLMSTKPGAVTIHGVECEFKASSGAFKRNGAWMDQYYFGTYRAHNNGGVPGSQPGKTHWGSVSFDAFKAAAEGMGNGHHMQSLFEWHEILARMVIEKATFQLFPESIRATQASCQWRGIQDMAYSGTVYAEWMDGVKTDINGKYQLWLEAGGTYETTKATAFNGNGESTFYSQGVVSGGQFDHLFLAATMGAASTSFIPDFSGRTNYHTGRICHSNFDAGNANGGAFNSYFYNLSSTAGAGIGSRLCKW
jgi:hypothetical protein